MESECRQRTLQHGGHGAHMFAFFAVDLVICVNHLRGGREGQSLSVVISTLAVAPVGMRYNAVDCFHLEKQVGVVTHASSSNLDLFFYVFGSLSGGSW